MSDKDIDLNKILNESFSRLDKLADGGAASSDDDKPKDVKDLSEITLGTPNIASAQFKADIISEQEENADDDEEQPLSDNTADYGYADEEVYDEEYAEETADGDDVYDDNGENGSSGSGGIDNSDDDYQDDEYDEDSYRDEDYDEDDDFIEEYKDVPNRPQLEFNMHDEKAPKKKKKRKVKPNNSVFVGSLVTIIVIAVSFILSFLSIQFGVEYIGLTRSDESITFDIPEGTTYSTVADLLYQKGIIENPTLFKAVMKISGRTNVVSGSITLSPNMTYPSIIAELIRSRKVYETVTVTFTEGISLYSAARMLEDEGVCSASDFLEAFNSDSGFDFEKDLDLSDQTLYKMEGFMFPDTYEFYLEDEAENVVNKIKQNFQDKMSPEIMKLVEKSGMSLYEVITLASIVQAEADTPDNMKLVASVFLNRLSNKEEFPQLQSDVTYFYVTNTIAAALGNTSVSSYEYLYSTYSCYGLPIGPIGNPGMDAILAVLEPEETTFCYFVTDSVTGEFYYASTYEEHQANCEKAGY